MPADGACVADDAADDDATPLDDDCGRRGLLLLEEAPTMTSVAVRLFVLLLLSFDLNAISCTIGSAFKTIVCNCSAVVAAARACVL